jgi:hypothetical protein
MSPWYIYNLLKTEYQNSGKVMSVRKIRKVFPFAPLEAIQEGIEEFKSVKDKL